MSRTILEFGDSGTFKTTNLGFWARYLHNKTGKKIRYIGLDGGGCQPLEPLIRAGIIDPFFVRSGHAAKAPITIMRKIGAGYWPDKLENGIWVGERLLPDDARIRKEIAGYGVEGLTSDADVVMDDLRNKQRRAAEETVTPFSETIGGVSETYGMNCRGHYNFAQREVLHHVKLFSNLPVEQVLFTAHEAKGEDEDTKSPIRGPGLAGKAATDKVAREVGECIHFELEMISVKATGPDGKSYMTLRPNVRCYFVSHPDPIFPRVIYKCKPRVPSEHIERLMEKWPAGFFVPTPAEGIDTFLKYEDELMEESVAALTSGMIEEKKAA